MPNTCSAPCQRAAHRFIIAREIEAPDKFGAIQSYRAAMAILKQQWQFTEELLSVGH